jgi:sterol desaturase/sphingolipid hydroxylase (fatty acid hydroxylase superfamily)
MEDIVSLLIPVVFIVGVVAERLFPARPLPNVRLWLLKGFVFFVLTGGINALIPALIGPRLGMFTIVDSSRLGVIGSAGAALLVSEFLSYWLHRSMHRFFTLWRWTHQMHHSAERVDIPGAVYFHPFDISLSVLATSLAAALVGASADAAALSGFATFLMAMFQHLNVKTPHVIGYLVQRPEGHSLHHERGLHAYNYGNLALFDLVFGTFRNPKGFSELAGFWDGSSAQVLRMFAGRDVGTRPGAVKTTSRGLGIGPVAEI